MRLTKTVLAVLAGVFMVSGVAYAQIDTTTGYIDGTAHDLRARLSINEVCVPCHAPHNAENGSEGPIWNHAITTTEVTRNGENITLQHSSKLCLSCHDGVTAVGDFGGTVVDPSVIIGDDAIGTDLTDSHPIGIDYDAEVGGSGIFEATADVEAAGYLDHGYVECGSCHHAHGGQDGKFLIDSNVNSQLCRTCHKF